MKQKPVTIICEVINGSQSEIVDYLEPIGKDIANTNIVKFSSYSQLHYCSFFLIPNDHPCKNDKNTNSRWLLVFEANIDGEIKQFIEELVSKNRDFIVTLYSNCIDFPNSSKDEIIKYLLCHEYGANTFYVAHPGQTKDIIEKQKKIRTQIREHVKQNEFKLSKLTPRKIVRNIHSSGLKIEHSPNQPFFNLYGSFVICGLGLLVFLLGYLLFQCFGNSLIIFLLLLIAGLLCLLRSHERNDKQDNRLNVEDTRLVQKIQTMEDQRPQNHLISVTEIKPGWFRLSLLYVVLFVINIFAKLKATKGNLSGIVTIHFARWVIIPGKYGTTRRLLFLSNYDGSWENYLGEFIDHASDGLTAVWSNTQLGEKLGFPNTRCLFKGGSRDERRFKTYARNSQIIDLIWYCAYLDLTVKNIGNNRDIHEGLYSLRNPANWLKKL